MHALVITAFYFLPAPVTKKSREFITQLVTPENKTQKIRPPLPVIPPRRAIVRRAPAAPQKRDIVPPPVILKPSAPSQSDVPLVPGEVKESGEIDDGEGKPHPAAKGRPGEGAADTRNAVEPARPGPRGIRELLDKGVTDSIAKRDSGKAGQGARKGEAFTFDTKEYRFAGYMNRLRDKIESIWTYPHEAAERGIYGDLKIRFTIRKNGRLENIELVRTSGFKMLDDAAMKALKDGEPYWPLPDEWGMERYTIEGHFIYSLYGYYLR